MEVHPPEHPIFTWKQFFIHMATVCLGLLIALGLEQFAEYLHHRHQLHLLRDTLQKEDEKSLRDLVDYAAFANANFAWYTSRIEQTRQGIRYNTPISDLPRTQSSIYTIPDDPAWKAAKASNLIDIMPQQEIIAHSEVEAIIKRVQDDALRPALPGKRSFVIAEQFRVATGSQSWDFSSASRADLTEYLQALTAETAAVRQMENSAAYLRGALQAVLRGERNLDRIEDEEKKVHEDMLKSRQQMLQAMQISGVDPSSSARNTEPRHRAVASRASNNNQ